MPSKTILAWNNYFKTGSISANSNAPAMNADNLAGDLCAPAMGWQTNVGVVSGASALLRVDAPTAGSTWRVFGLFQTNLTSSATMIFTLWLSAGPTSVWSSGTVFGPQPGYGQVIVVAPSDQTADFLQIEFSDTTNPDAFLNIGGAFAGPAWFPESGISWGSTTGRDEAVTRSVTRGGQEYGDMQWQKRTWAIGFEGVRNAEMWTQLDSLRRHARTTQNVLFIPDHTSSYLQNEATYGILTDVSAVGFPARSADRRSWQATISERL